MANFIEEFQSFQKEVHQVSKLHGWHDAPAKTPLECLMLMVAELSEAAEEIREGKPNLYLKSIYDGSTFSPQQAATLPLESYRDTLKPEGVAAELADTVLRILDFAEAQNIALIEVILMKHSYNITRPYKHGKLL